jgi:hypothetical protein
MRVIVNSQIFILKIFRYKHILKLSSFKIKYGKNSMRKNTIKGFVCAVFFSFLITSCSGTGTKLTSTSVNESLLGKPVFNILVIGVGPKNKERERRLFEDSFVARLQATGTEAISSLNALTNPSIQMLKKDDIIEAVKKYNNDAIIVIRAMGLDETEDYSGVQRSYYPYYGHAYGHYGSPGYYSINTTYQFQTNLYDVKTEKIIWSGTSETLNPDSTMQVIDNVIDVVIKDLQKSGLLNKPKETR